MPCIVYIFVCLNFSTSKFTAKRVEINAAQTFLLDSSKESIEDLWWNRGEISWIVDKVNVISIGEGWTIKDEIGVFHSPWNPIKNCVQLIGQQCQVSSWTLNIIKATFNYWPENDCPWLTQWSSSFIGPTILQKGQQIELSGLRP